MVEPWRCSIRGSGLFRHHQTCSSLDRTGKERRLKRSNRIKSHQSGLLFCKQIKINLFPPTPALHTFLPQPGPAGNLNLHCMCQRANHLLPSCNRLSYRPTTTGWPLDYTQISTSSPPRAPKSSQELQEVPRPTFLAEPMNCSGTKQSQAETLIKSSCTFSSRGSRVCLCSS